MELQHDQEQAIPIRELDATAHPPLQHNQLMSECRVLCLKSALRLERRGEQGEEEAEQRDDRVRRFGPVINQDEVLITDTCQKPVVIFRLSSRNKYELVATSGRLRRSTLSCRR